MYDFTVLILEDAYPSSVSATLDILSTAAQAAPQLAVPVPKWRVCSIDGGSTRLQGGMSVTTTPLPREAKRKDGSMWVLPGLGFHTPTAIRDRLNRDDARAAATALREHVEAGGRVAASCASVFLLHEAGVLQGRRVTTSWWLAAQLRRLASKTTVDAQRMVCSDGPIVTAGAAFAQTDLMLHLLRTAFGNQLATAVSRALLIDGRQAQASTTVPEAFSSGDELIGRVTARIEASLPDAPKVSELASEFCMSERTLCRYVVKATGKSTSSLVQSVRQRRARMLLESSRLTVEQVAAAVGYQDGTALRRMMRKLAGANPSHFRPTGVTG